MKEATRPATISLIILFIGALSLSPALTSKATASHDFLTGLLPHDDQSAYIDIKVESITDMKDGTWSLVGRDAHNVKSSYICSPTMTEFPQAGDMIHVSTLKGKAFSWRKQTKSERSQFRQTRKNDKWQRKHKDELALKSKVELATELAVPGFILVFAAALYLIFR